VKKIRSLCSDKFLLVDFLEKKQETDTQCENGSVEERKICCHCKLSSLVIGIGTRYVSFLVMRYNTVYDFRLRISENIYYDSYYKDAAKRE